MNGLIAGGHGQRIAQVEMTDQNGAACRGQAVVQYDANGKVLGVDGPTQTVNLTAGAPTLVLPTQGFGGGTFDISAIGVGSVVSFQQSFDGVAWGQMEVASLNGTGPTLATSTGAAGPYSFNAVAPYVRANLTTVGTGTTTVISTLKQFAQFTTAFLAPGNNAVGNVNVSVGYTDTTTLLAGSATFTGTARATASQSQSSYFNANAITDQAGTLYIDQSLDTGGSWNPVASGALAANVSTPLRVPLTGAFSSATLYRVRVVNGATAETFLRVSSSFTAN